MIAKRLFSILLISILLFAGVAYAAPGKTRLTLDEAKALINERVFGNQLQEIFLHELTTDEVWNRMGVQVFVEGFLIDGDRILLLCQDPDFTFGNQLFVGDLNRDGAPELIYSYTITYTRSTDVIAIYTNGAILDEIPVDAGEFTHIVALTKSGEAQIKVTVSKENPPTGQARWGDLKTLVLRYNGSGFVLE